MKMLNIGVDKFVKMMYKHIPGFGETNRDHEYQGSHRNSKTQFHDFP